MGNPYFIDEPAAISFSGGRTSAYMLYKILEAHGGTLPEYVKVTFANTGKEMPQTLDFVRDCGEQWDVDIAWIELGGYSQHGFYESGRHKGKPIFKPETKIVNYETASRIGQPFEHLINHKKFLPNPSARVCTIELKIMPIERYMGCEYTTIVGIRADEPRRAVKQKAKDNYLAPLFDAGVTIKDVKDFWGDQPFDLELPTMPNGVCNLSNCDLCFLKGSGIKISIVEHQPSLADWWIKQEEKIGSTFRSDQPSYEQFKGIAATQTNLFAFDDESIPCFCGD